MLDEKQILAITAPKRPRQLKVNSPPKVLKDEELNNVKNITYKNELISENNNNILDGSSTSEIESCNEHSVSTTNTTPRLKEIQNLISQYNSNLEVDFSKTVIQPVTVQIDKLRQNISQLLIEIIKTVSDQPLIEKASDQLGFNCINTLSDDKSTQTLIVLLQVLLHEPKANEHNSLVNLLSLLTGLKSKNTEIIRLDEISFVKLIQVLGLIRKYVELTE